MALTITRPNYWTITLSSDTVGVFNFKYVVNLTDSNGALITTFKAGKNPQGVAHIDFERVVKSYIRVTNKHTNTITGSIDYDSIHLIPQNTTDVGTAAAPDVEDYPFSKNNNTLKTFEFECFESYATTEGGVESLHNQSDVSYQLINYADEWEDGKELDVDLFSFKYPTSILGKFLTNLPYDTSNNNATGNKVAHMTSYNDYKTFSWLNEDGLYGTDDGNVVYTFFEDVPIFESISGRITATNYVGKINVENSISKGGQPPSSADSDDEYLLYAGVGGGNVKNIKYPDKGGFQLLENSNVKYYTVYYGDNTPFIQIFSNASGDNIKQGDNVLIKSTGGTIDYTTIGAPNNDVGTLFYASGTPTGSGTFWMYRYVPLSKEYLFEIASDSNCNSTRFDEYSLAWKNKYGTWDYYMFDGEHTDVRNYKREIDYNRVAGGWSDAAFTIDSFERGKVQKVTGTKQTTINTRFITDEYNDYFNGLLMSNEVLLLTPVQKGDDDIKQVPIPINIKDTSLTYKTNLKDKLVQYSFTFEYAHDLKQRI